MRGIVAILFIAGLSAGCYESTNPTLLGRHTTDPCAPSTPDGECSVVHRCGCPSRQWCAWTVSFEAGRECSVRETCEDVAQGTQDVGTACDSSLGNHPCRPGATCLGPGLDLFTTSGICSEWCQVNDDCHVPGSRCVVSSHLHLSGCSEHLLFPYLLCSQE